jgi:hypothetical protein
MRNNFRAALSRAAASDSLIPLRRAAASHSLAAIRRAAAIICFARSGRRLDHSMSAILVSPIPFWVLFRRVVLPFE